MKYLLDTHAFIWMDDRPEKLPHHHRDPFDRLLIAQAMTEDIPIITDDKQIVQYSITTIWDNFMSKDET